MYNEVLTKMNYAEKIKVLQHKASNEEDKVNPVAWIGIYALLFNSFPTNTDVKEVIKAVQEKVNVKPSGSPSPQTWAAIHQLAVAKTSEVTEPLDPFNQAVLKGMTSEVVPFATELICLAVAEGIEIKIINKRNTNLHTRKSWELHKTSATKAAIDSFGLSFDIAIFEKNDAGLLIHQQDATLGQKVIKLAQSIGLTAVAQQNPAAQFLHFEIRPAWAVHLTDQEMLAELWRRKEEGINLLAIL